MCKKEPSVLTYSGQMAPFFVNSASVSGLCCFYSYFIKVHRRPLLRAYLLILVQDFVRIPVLTHLPCSYNTSAERFVVVAKQVA